MIQYIDRFIICTLFGQLCLHKKVGPLVFWFLFSALIMSCIYQGVANIKDISMDWLGIMV